MKLQVVMPRYDYYNIKGLTFVDELDYSSGDYEFDLRAVWVDSQGRLWTDRDAGCSCPSPFEDTTELDRCFIKDLEDEYLQEIQDGNRDAPTQQEFETFIEKVKAAMVVP